MKKILFLTLSMMCLSVLAEDKFPNVLFLDEGAQSPKADLDIVQWLAGHWQGQAFGGVIEEIWAPAIGGSMMGAFKLVVDEKVEFYELETIVEEGESLVFRLKHFNRDLTGWEEKDRTIDFKLVKIADNKVFFNGMTLEKINDKAMNIYVAIEDKGQVTEEVFSYTKIDN